ncbi:MAG: hypothetical protein N3E47_07980, partial [Candidatus Bathyarchaeota archaeon]|nr:hypothetical protein [Candidatus Bathyarchaeota archaeon]
LITPSLERRWKPPTKPRGDLWTVPLPFRTPYRNEVLGLLRYLKEYYSGIGFERRGFVIQKVAEIDADNLTLTINVALLPSELNINQEVKIYTIYGEDNYIFFVDVKRISGDPSAWVKRCIFFLSDIRQQLLLWKSLPDKERKRYLSEQFPSSS